MPVLIPLPTRRLTGMLAKVEATYGTDAAPVVGTDGVRINGNFWNIIKPSYAWPNLRDEAATGSIFPASAGIPKGSMAAMDFLVEVKGQGTAYTGGSKPEADPLLQACGWNSVNSGGAGSEIVTYTLLQGSHKSATIWGYAGGMVYKVVGCRGTMNWIMRAGELGAMRFQMMGILSSITAAAQATITSYDAALPVGSVNMGVSLGPYDPTWTVAEFIQGGNVQRIDSGNATDGIAFFDWLTVDPAFTITVKAPDDGTGKFDTANFNPFADATARTSRAIDATIGSVQYNKAVLTIGSTYVAMPDPAEENEAAALNLRYTITDSGMSIVYN